MSLDSNVTHQIGQRCWRGGWWLLLWGCILSLIAGLLFVLSSIIFISTEETAVGVASGIGVVVFWILIGISGFMLSVAPILIVIGWVIPEDPAMRQEREAKRIREYTRRQEQERYRAEQERKRQAAEQGDTETQFNLGTRYFFGEGLLEDKAEGIKWYRKAAKQGHAEAQYNLGMCYFYGYGVLEDKAEGLKLFCEAAGQGHAKAKEQLKQMGIN